MNIKRCIEYLRDRWAEGSTRRALFLFVTSGAALAGYSLSDATVERWLGWINGIMVFLGVLGMMLPDDMSSPSKPATSPSERAVEPSQQEDPPDAKPPVTHPPDHPSGDSRPIGRVLRYPPTAGPHVQTIRAGGVAGPKKEQSEPEHPGWNG